MFIVPSMMVTFLKDKLSDRLLLWDTQESSVNYLPRLERVADTSGLSSRFRVAKRPGHLLLQGCVLISKHQLTNIEFDAQANSLSLSLTLSCSSLSQSQWLLT